MQYWLDLFTGKSWKEFQDAGANVSGYPESRRATVEKMHSGDTLLCYLTRVSRFCGALEIVGGAFSDSTRIWSDRVFPERVHVNPLVVLAPAESVPIKDLSSKLSFFSGPGGPGAWSGHVRVSPSHVSDADGGIIMAALREAAKEPVQRPFDPRRLDRSMVRERLPAGIAQPPPEPPQEQVQPLEDRSHLEMQWLLLKLGSDMGLSTWVARNDRGRSYKDYRFSNIPGIRESLPQQFDPQTNQIIEHIDVLWLRGNSIESAFEIEHTTSIYSGILRMSDLLALHPNLDIRLYIVAPDERRAKVKSELNRPTFAMARRPLTEVCKFLPYSAIRREIERLGETVRYVRPELIEHIAESCKE